MNQGYVDMVKAFEVYDKLGRGVLGRDDFKRVLKHFTVDLTKAQIENLLRRYASSSATALLKIRLEFGLILNG